MILIVYGTWPTAVNLNYLENSLLHLGPHIETILGEKQKQKTKPAVSSIMQGLSLDISTVVINFLFMSFSMFVATTLPITITVY